MLPNAGGKPNDWELPSHAARNWSHWGVWTAQSPNGVCPLVPGPARFDFADPKQHAGDCGPLTILEERRSPYDHLVARMKISWLGRADKSIGRFIAVKLMRLLDGFIRYCELTSSI
jgi:hypothetical protein